jgi:hypothetical protein
MKGRIRRIHRAPLALTSDGTVVANLAHFDDLKDAYAALERALQLGRLVFISVALTPEEVAFVLKRIDDSGADALAWLLGKKKRARKTTKEAKPEASQPAIRRVTVRKSRSTTS